MAEGKPYRYGLIVAGMCVSVLGLFIMTQDQPHIYVTMCVLGVVMVAVGTVWSLCQCYPKITLAGELQDKSQKEQMCTSAEAQPKRDTEGLATFYGEKITNRCHSCPTLQLV
ncbi:barttin [Thalassophryne amazonica]|uniref:barttin n=1 Tax=Thalassophryne amazonica TaxID=390379 RepID=UPI0014721774|nr:barttin [Thalassophryne amazonica]